MSMSAHTVVLDFSCSLLGGPQRGLPRPHFVLHPGHMLAPAHPGHTLEETGLRFEKSNKMIVFVGLAPNMKKELKWKQKYL